MVLMGAAPAGGEWNDTAADYPEKTIHDLFAEQARRTPEAVAVVAGAARLRFADVEEMANRIAHHLRAVGARRGSLVGVCLDRSAEMVPVLLGVLKAGAAYLPLDPSYPAQRLSFIAADSGVQWIVTEERFADRLPEGAQLVFLDRDRGQIAARPGGDPGAGARPDDWCFVVYTSGSTGAPKGVGSSHRSSVVMFSWMWQAHPFEPGERCGQRTTLNFVVAVWEIFLPLLRGVPVVIVPDPITKDPTGLADHLGQQGVTRLLVVPTLLRAILLAVPDIAARAPLLRRWISVGEPLAVDLARRFVELLPGATLLNLYGCSETHSSACYALRGEVPEAMHVPIGTPLSNRRAYILDGALDPTPTGTPGEIYVAGDGLSWGYINRPDLSAERFLPDPFSPTPGGILYRTGDRGRRRPDGNLELLGRVDNQVQIRGFRVELAEVEAAMLAHPDVTRCAVAARQGGGETYLAAYFVAGGRSPTVTELREHLSAVLPDYMIPTSFTPLDALPTTPNGKLDRLALPDPSTVRPSLRANYIAPRTPTEEAICEIWQSALQLDRIGVEDSFFDLGGYSNKATAVIVQMRRRWSVELTLKTFFELQTVARLAERVDVARWLSQDAAQQSTEGLVRGEIE